MKVITIGRSSANDIIINDRQVSRRHCQIVQHDNGAYSLVDLGSTNGTFINGLRISGQVTLNPNDTVRIGGTTLQWQYYFQQSSPVNPAKPVKAITFGRSSQNNVTIDDSFVGRHHCQIVLYDNGAFAIIDFGSTNGTFVNGMRVQGSSPLNLGDIVTIGNTTLNWANYFETAVKPPKSPKTRPWVFGSLAVAAMVAAIIVLVITLLTPKDIPYNGSSLSPTTVLYSENGVRYPVEAIPGEVVVIFDDDVSHRDATKIIEQCDGKIIAQKPKAKYYVVSVTQGEEDAFIQRVRERKPNLFIYPNAVSELCMAKPIVLDNYKHPLDDGYTHGVKVEYSFANGGGSNLSIDHRDIGISNCSCVNNASAKNELLDILDNISEGNSPIINMSFGTGFSYEYEGYWDNAPDSVKRTYIHHFIKDLNGYIKIAKTYDEKDFVVVKAMGNNGLKDIGHTILLPYLDTLNATDKSILERHFLLVAAKDDNWTTYSNEMAKGTHTSLVTTMDISDLRYINGKDMHGTSYASPRTAGYIAKVMNEYNISAVDALKYTKQATEQEPNHLLTYQRLENIVKQNHPKKDDPIKTDPPQKPAPTQVEINSQLEQVARDWMEASAKQDLKTLQRLSTLELYNEIIDDLSKNNKPLSSAEKKKAEKAARELPIEIISYGGDRYCVRFNNRPQGIEGHLNIFIQKEYGEWKVYKASTHVTNRNNVSIGQSDNNHNTNSAVLNNQDANYSCLVGTKWKYETERKTYPYRREIIYNFLSDGTIRSIMREPALIGYDTIEVTDYKCRYKGNGVYCTVEYYEGVEILEHSFIINGNVLIHYVDGYPKKAPYIMEFYRI